MRYNKVIRRTLSFALPDKFVETFSSWQKLMHSEQFAERKIRVMFTTYLYVGNLPSSFNREMLETIFLTCKVQLTEVLPGKGFAYVAIASSDARAAIDGLDGKVFERRHLYVSRATFFDDVVKVKKGASVKEAPTAIRRNYRVGARIKRAG